jgi:hypothetical protein
LIFLILQQSHARFCAMVRSLVERSGQEREGCRYPPETQGEIEGHPHESVQWRKEVESYFEGMKREKSSH